MMGDIAHCQTGSYEMTVSEKILSALREKIDGGATVYVIAKAVGVSHSVIARFLSEERKQIRSETIDRLCEYLGLELVESPAKLPATPAASKSPAKTASRPAKAKLAGKPLKSSARTSKPAAGRRAKR